MVHIKVQPHTNRICRNQVINIPILIEFNLRISGARTKRPHHHCCTAFLSADQFRNRINTVHRKPHDCAARWHAGYFFRSRIGQLAHPFTAHDLNVGYQFGNRPPHCICAQEQSFFGAANAQQPVCENMTTLGICTQLDFINNGTINSHIVRHRFNGTNPIHGTRRDNTFFPCDQRHNRGSADGDDFVVHFAGQ